MENHRQKSYLTAAYQYSLTRFALNYFTYYEMAAEIEHLPDSLAVCNEKLNKLVSNALVKTDFLRELYEFRDEIKNRVQILTSYADCFQTYEYVLNRMERRFHALPAADCSDEKFAKMLVDYLKRSDESALKNERVQIIVGELPVRLTRQKFFGYISDSLSSYIGSPAKALRRMVELLRCEALTDLSKEAKEKAEKIGKDGYVTMNGMLGRLNSYDYRAISPSEYEEASGMVKFAGEFLTRESGFYTILMELVNDLMVLALSGNQAETEEEMISQKEIVRIVLNWFLDGEKSAAEDEIEGLLGQLEGKQELYYERVAHSGGGEDQETFELQIDRLLSGSIFADLDVDQEQESLTVDKDFLNRELSRYFSDIGEILDNAQKPVRRAVMAKTMSILPVFFHSVGEIRDYIDVSLSCCSDVAEKETCKEILTGVMESDNALV